MNPEVEQALNRKVDNWEFHSLQSEVQRLRNQINDIIREKDHLKNIVSNQRHAIEELIDLFIECELLGEDPANLYNIKQYL